MPKKLICAVRPLPLLVAIAAASLPLGANAAEVEFDGYYRARMRMYDTLSLTRELPNDQLGLAAYGQHRFWLRPQIYIDEDVAVFADIRGLDGAFWGSRPAVVDADLDGEPDLVEFNDDLTTPDTTIDVGGNPGEAPQLNIQLWRAWGEVDTALGHIAFGRMPLHWGAGIWWNDGLSWNGEYGDSADRVLWSHTFGDVFAEAAIDANAEALFWGEDDTMSFNGAFGYRSELVTAGIRGQYRATPANDFNLFTIDGALQAQVGTIDVQAEVIGQFGAGDLSAAENDVRVAAFGAVLDVELHTDAVDIGLQGGLATGDGDPNDAQRRAFVFDRDYNVGLILFEQPLPLLALADSPNYAATQLGPAVTNAMYLRPRVSRGIIDGLEAEAAVLAARAATLPETQEGRSGYGIEINAGVEWTPLEHFTVTGTGAVLLPGTYFTEFEDDTFDAVFDENVFAGQIIGQIRF